VTTSSRPTTDPTPAPEPPDRIEQSWRRFKEAGDGKARESLILHYSPLVKFVAGRVGVGLPRSVEQADLVSYGMFGLIDAIDKFEPSRGIKFETYAVNRIKGAILDELRALDWVPRSVRARAREIQRSLGELEASLHRSVSDEELAEHMGLPVATLQDQLGEIAGLGFIALDELVDPGERGSAAIGDLVADPRAIDPGGSFEQQEGRYMLVDAVNRLAERERLVITLYYYEGLTLAEIGDVLGVTESRVCQIHTKAVLSLRYRLLEPGQRAG
jgi:RNA polymerase sigma factor for flagellar operon FliA